MEAKLVHVNPKKKEEVEKIKSLVKEYPVMGVVNLENLPAAHFLKIKHRLRDKILIKVTKKRLMKIAFEQLENEKKGILKVEDLLTGIPALIFTREDEFKLQKIINKNKTSAFAKPGYVTDKDIYIKSGPTQFTPGPMIGEFGVLGIKTQVLENKIHIKEDKLLVKAQEAISDKIASMLVKLGIEPMEIGLNLMFTFKNGEILTKDNLNINEEEYLNNLKKAFSEALNLAVESSYIEKDTIDILLRKAYLNALSLNNKVGDLGKGAQEEIKEEQKEEKIEEVKKEETLKEKLNQVKEPIEVKDSKYSDDDQKRAADILRQLTDKKIRGEI